MEVIVVDVKNWNVFEQLQLSQIGFELHNNVGVITTMGRQFMVTGRSLERFKHGMQQGFDRVVIEPEDWLEMVGAVNLRAVGSRTVPRRI